MAYVKQNWHNLPNQTTPLSAQRLNHLETQYDEAISEVPGIVNSAINDISLIPPTRGQLPNGTDLNDCRGASFAGSWQIISTNTYPNAPHQASAATVFTVDVGNSNNAVLQQWVESSGGSVRIFSRKLINPTGNNGGPLYTPWARMLSLEDVTPSLAILDLARRDGWVAVYDPSNTEAISVDSGGLVTSIRDGLGNLPALTPSLGNEPLLAEREFGQLSGITTTGNKRVNNTFQVPIQDPMCIVALGKWTGAPEGSGFDTLFDGSAGGRKNLIVRKGQPGAPFGFGSGHGTEYKADNSPHIFTYNSRPEIDEIYVDGQFAAFRPKVEGNLNGLTLGATPGGGNNWHGTIGVVLIYEGEPPADKLDRMHSLLMSMTGRSKGPHILRPNSVVYSATASGRPTLMHGDVDSIYPSGIESITKLMTLVTARKYLSNNDLDTIIYAVESDLTGNAPWEPGDGMTYRDWFWCSLGPSFNAPNELVARTVGQFLLDQESGTGDPRARFLQEMNDTWGSWGFGSEPFRNPSFGAAISARDTVFLLQKAMEDPELFSLMETLTRSVSVVGPNPRTLNYSSTLRTGPPYDFVEYVAGKTGGGNGVAHLVTSWVNPLDGEIHVTAVMNTPLAEPEMRYTELKKVMVATSFSGANVALTPSTSPDFSDGLAKTGELNITEEIGATVVSSGGGVWLERQGDFVLLTFAGVSLPDNFSGPVVPSGFRPYNWEYGSVTVRSGDESVVREVSVSSSGNVSIFRNLVSEALRGSLIWRTRQPWPESV